MFEKTLMKSLLVGLLTALFIMATGCAQGNGGGEASGNILVRFSGAAASSVTSAQAVITAPDISPDIVVDLAVGPGQAGGVILGIPAGLGRQITVNAYANTQLLCTGSALVGITADQTVQVAMVLQCQGAGVETGGVIVDGQLNYPPQIASVFASAAAVQAGGQIAVTVSATDPDGDPLSYSWAATCGTVMPADQAQAQWTAPGTPGTTCTLTVTASDNRAGQTSLSFDLATQAAALSLTSLTASCVPGAGGMVQFDIVGEGFDGPSGDFSDVYLDATFTLAGNTGSAQMPLLSLTAPSIVSANELILYLPLASVPLDADYSGSMRVSVPSLGLSTAPLSWSQAKVREYCAPVAAASAAVSMAGSAPTGIAVGDFGGGSGKDMAILDGTGNALQVLWNDSIGGFPSADQTIVDAFTAAPRTLLAADLNPVSVGDEIVVGGSDGVARIYGSARSAYNLSGEADFATEAGSQQINDIVATDTDGDSDLDLIVAADNGFGIVTNDSGSFMIAAFITNAGGIAELAVADFSGDGTRDAAFVRTSGAPIVLFADPGRSLEMLPLAGAAEHVAVGDFDANGTQDIAVSGVFSEPAAAPLLIYLNDGAGHFTYHGFDGSAVALTNNALLAVDSNTDGLSEVLSAQGNRVGLIFPNYNFLGSGADVLGQEDIPQDLQNTTAVVASDLNGDGLTDFAATDSAASEVRIYWGKSRESLP